MHKEAIIQQHKDAIIQQAAYIHDINVRMGWWDKPRSDATFACLIHSEVSEAMEGERKGLKDDHLPEYEMFWVELADTAIRIFDYLGSVDCSKATIMKNPEKGERIEVLQELHTLIAFAFSHENSKTLRLSFLMAVLNIIYNLADKEVVDIQEIINTKVEYNQRRADHKRENREKEGGKKF